MKNKLLVLAVCIITAMIGTQLYLIRRWFVNKYEYRRWLFVVVDEKSPKIIYIHNNCFTGDDLVFKSGISSVYAVSSQIHLIDNIKGVSIRVLDKANVLKDNVYLQSNTKFLDKIESFDSTSFCGIYKKIYLK